MSVWSDDPEWFDDWLTEQALHGRFGPEQQKLAEDGDFDAREWFNLDTSQDLCQEALEVYYDRGT